MLCSFDIKTIYAIVKKNEMTKNVLKAGRLYSSCCTLVFVVLMLHFVEVCVVEVLDGDGNFGGSDEGKVE